MNTMSRRQFLMQTGGLAGERSRFPASSNP